MASSPEHAEEFETDATLAQRLVAAQFPQWSHMPIARVDAASTDNDMYQLGDRLAVRLPRRESAVAPIDKEHEWLPRLAPKLPVGVPVPVEKGTPDLGYPYPWGIVRWLEGEPPSSSSKSVTVKVACDLAAFIGALHSIDATTGPAPGAHNYWRGVTLRAWDAQLRQRFDWLSDLEDIDAVVSAWERDLGAPRWDRPPVWIHGDLKDANLLVTQGALSGVLDWSCAGVGDPAGDLAIAWTLLEGEARDAFRDALAADTATWTRGRAWALIEGVLGLSYYRGKNDALATAGRRIIDAVLADHARGR